MVLPMVNVPTLRQSILDDLFKDFDNSRKWVRKLLEPLAWISAHRFAEIAARFDETVANSGFHEAMRQIVSHLVSELYQYGSELVPRDGPLLVVSNHPGAYDSLAIAASLPRDDLKIIATGFPLLRRLPHACQHLIFTDSQTGSGFFVARAAIRHLRSGGSLLMFPSGRVEPDPAVLPGAVEAVRAWSPSVGLLLSKVPQTKVLITIVSDVLAPIFLHNPLIKLWRGIRDPQAVAETLQIITQMLFSQWVRSKPRISFNLPKTIDELRQSNSTLYHAIITEARRLLLEHIHGYYS